jgi:hypothetical protein
MINAQIDRNAALTVKLFVIKVAIHEEVGIVVVCAVWRP